VRLSRSLAVLTAGLAAVGGGTLLLHRFHANPTTAALAFLLTALFVAAAGPLWAAVATSIAAILCFNFFFLPPVGTWAIVDPENWVALLALLVASIVASQLSARARARAEEAGARRREVALLFDLTRDILQTGDDKDLMPATARHIARRFEAEQVALAFPTPAGGWQVHEGGARPAAPPAGDLDLALAAAGHRPLRDRGLLLVPLRLGTTAVGVVAITDGHLESGTIDAIAGITAVAFERSQFMAERRAAEIAHERAELSSALLAAMSHDLRTPLTALRVAVANLSGDALDPAARSAQAALAAAQAERLTRLFDEILDMARIESKSIRAERSWCSPAEIVDAAVAHAGASLGRHHLSLDVDARAEVNLDPRLTAASLAHLLENAARYSPAGTGIAIRASIDTDGLRVCVMDEGPGLEAGEIDHLFTPLFRGRAGRSLAAGTGMGLAITRGLLAAEGGRAWAEPRHPRGACFSIAVPAQTRPAVAGAEAT
jgi:two-component system sensor histidine kinase KdpD